MIYGRKKIASVYHTLLLQKFGKFCLKLDQIDGFKLHLLQKPLMENFIFCAVRVEH